MSTPETPETPTSSEIRIDLFPNLSAEKVAEKLEEFDGDWNRVFDWAEQALEAMRAQNGQKRYYMAECRVCSYDGKMKMPFEDIEKRDEWAREHSKIVVTRGIDNGTGLTKHNVKVYEEYR